MFKNLTLLITIFISIGTFHCQAKKVLFIGNSYTGQCSKIITEFFKAEGPDWELTFHWKGGKDLSFHLADPDTKKLIRSTKWDFVVLQEQSQKSGLGGEFSKGFHQAVGSFAKIIQKAGSTPCLYLTWGRKAGDKKNPKAYPNYRTMQKKISAAYLKAAQENNALVLPVGLAYSETKERDQALFESLYKKDGSHPSTNGAYLVSCIFWSSLSGKDPTSVTWTGRLTGKEANMLRQSAKVALTKMKRN